MTIMGNAPKKKYELIVNRMKQELDLLKLEPHQEFLTDREAMERFGGSRITVRRAFAQLEQEGLVYRQRGKGTMISPNRGRRHKLFAYMGFCVVTSGSEPMWIKGIEDYLVNHNSSLILCNLENNLERARIYIERFSKIGIDGVILLPMETGAEVNLEIVASLKKKRIPVVLIDRSIPGEEGNLPCVRSDHFDGGRQITQHLLGLGHRRIAFFYTLNMENISSIKERYHGYEQALHDASIEIDPELVGKSSVTTVHYQITRWMNMPNPPTAIFVEHDLTMLRIMEVLQSQSIRIPEDVSLAGYDDIPRLMMPIPHTTIRAPLSEMGQTAAMQMLAIAEDPDHGAETVILPVSLQIRQTTGINKNLSLTLSGIKN